MEPTPPCTAWKDLLAEEMRRVAVLRPWGRAVMAVGWVHLAFFLVCQAAYSAGVRAEWVSVALWAGEVGAVLLTVRAAAGPGWFGDSTAVQLVARVWGTFLILSFNVASLNTLTGFEVDWFKPVWCTLASFGFATMAWLFGARLLVPAFQMYFTGLLMVQLPGWNYLIHGVSWCLALQWVGLGLEARRRKLAPASPARLVVTYTREPAPGVRETFLPQVGRLYAD